MLRFLSHIDKKVLLVFLIALLARVLLLPFAEVTDSDAVTRIFLAQSWLDSPTLISEGVWPPIHYYFIAFSIFISGELWYAPMILHILFATLTLFPLYNFTRREIGENGALLACIIYAFSPVMFHNSYHALSGIPNAFFVAHTLNQLSLLKTTSKLQHAIFAGIAITIGAGFRYESWMLIAIFTFMLLLFRVPIKKIFVFWLFAMIFPIFWMIGNYIAHKDMFFGLSGAYYWNIVMEDVNVEFDSTEGFKRLIFFPLSWILVVTPLAGILVVLISFRSIVRRTIDRDKLIWLIPFAISMMVFCYKSYEGTLLNQHRFSIGLLILSIPFFASIGELRKKFLKYLVYVSIPISFISAFYGTSLKWEGIFVNERIVNVLADIRLTTYATLTPVPVQTDKMFSNIGSILKKERGKSDGLIVDFWTWESSFYMALKSGFKPNDIYLVDGAANGVVFEPELEAFLKKHVNPMIFINCSSKLQPYYSVESSRIQFNVNNYSKEYNLGIRFNKDGAILLSSNSTKFLDFYCPEPQSKEGIRSVIRKNLTWLNDVQIKASRNGVPLEEMLNLEAQWLIDNQ